MGISENLSRTYLSSEADGPACLAGNLISNADKKLCSIHQFACTLVWCPARPAKRDLFNNFTPILLHPQPMLTFKRLSIWRHFRSKYHITTKKNKEHSCPYWLPAQRDTSPKMKINEKWITLMLSKICMNAFQNYLFCFVLSTQWDKTTLDPTDFPIDCLR